MGIEPTRDFVEPHTGFEDQARHRPKRASSHEFKPQSVCRSAGRWGLAPLSQGASSAVAVNSIVAAWTEEPVPSPNATAVLRAYAAGHAAAISAPTPANFLFKFAWNRAARSSPLSPSCLFRTDVPGEKQPSDYWTFPLILLRV